MQSGKLRHRITVLQYTESLNAYGENTPAQDFTEWTTFATIWGSMNPVTGYERLQNDRQESELKYKFGIRYLNGLKTSMVFKTNDRYFQLEEILPDRTDARKQTVIAIEK